VEQHRQYKATQNGLTSPCSNSHQTNKQLRHLIDLHPIHNQAISRKFTLLRDGFLNSFLPLIIRCASREVLPSHLARATSPSPITHLFTSFFSSYVLLVFSSLFLMSRSGKTEPSGSNKKICVLSGK
jgi:hypothetical protein